MKYDSPKRLKTIGKTPVKKSKQRLKAEATINQWIAEQWQEFNKSPKDRQAVLDVFDDAINRHFTHKPKIAKWFQVVKESFLEVEAKNNV